jgi:ubiquinone/menaquinone biosynthesis C-methylase UbiE/GT2 family glycosyltransferase
LNTILFSVIIPTCDRPDLLCLCLDAIAPGIQNIQSEYYETIVTDDGNSTVEKLLNESYPWVKWVKGPQKGPAANRNNGSQYAKGEWLVFTDDDCLPSKEWLATFQKSILKNIDVKAFEGSIHSIGNINKDFAECPINYNGGCFWSANICIDRNLYCYVKGFDENYIIAAQEDQDLFIKLKKHTVILFVSDATVFHPVRISSFWKSIKKIKVKSLNWLYYANKNKEELGYKNEFAIIKSGYNFHLRGSFKAFIKMYPRQFLYAIGMLLYGMPLIILYLLIINRLRNRKFQWISSKTGDKRKLDEVDKKLSWYYTEDSWRDTYQIMLGEESIPQKSDFYYLILDYILKKKASNILDIGCSNGRIFRQLKQLGFSGQYTGIEVSDYLIEMNRKNHVDASWKTAGAYNIPYADDEFDLCFAFFVLEHLVFPEKALNAMMKVVKKNGVLVLIFPDFVASGRLSSQQLGLSPNDTALQKLKKGKVFDALLSFYDSRIRLPRALKNVHNRVGDFPVNTNLICFNHPNLMSPDFDAVYIASKLEVENWAVKNGYKVSYPYGTEGELNEKAFLVIEK